MSSDRDITRIVRSWLEEGVTALPDQVLDAVLDELPTTPQRRASWLARRHPAVNLAIRIAVAAAVLLVAVLVGYRLLPGPNVGSSGPTATPLATPSPTPSATPEERLLEPGTTVTIIDDNEFPSGIRVTATVPAADWYGPGILTKPDTVEPPYGAGLIAWASELFVYGDPCQWTTTRPELPAGTVDELVAALSAQPMRGATAPTDITVDGYAGKAIELTVPDDLDLATCEGAEFRSWTDAVGGARYHQGPGQHDLVWIIDVDGTPVVIDTAVFEGTPDAVRAELQAILDSIQIEPQP